MTQIESQSGASWLSREDLESGRTARNGRCPGRANRPRRSNQLRVAFVLAHPRHGRPDLEHFEIADAGHGCTIQCAAQVNELLAEHFAGAAVSR